MERRICKNADLELSVIGTGCWSFGGGEYWGPQNQKDVNEIIHASVELGINYFDTAETYNEGRSESSLGEAIKGIPREKFLIGSKVSPSNCYRKLLVEHCEKSLKRLQADYIDLYMIHWPIHPHSLKHFTDDLNIINNPPDSGEAIDTLAKLKTEGKIRHFGVSNFSRTRLTGILSKEIAVNELPYNLLCRAVEFDILSFCEQNGIGVIGYMPLLQGILADIYPTFNDIPDWQKRTRHFNYKNARESRHGEEGAEDETKAALEGIRQICKGTGFSMAEIALKWTLANSAIKCILTGSRNLEELQKNIKSVQNPLSEDIKKALDEVTLPLMIKLKNHFDYYESAENDRTL